MDITLRPVTAEDALCLHIWQRHPATRCYARNRDVPDWPSHCGWLANKIEDTDCVFRMILFDGKPAGTVRLDRDRERYEVSINVAPELHRQGIGGEALNLIARESTLPVVAEVHPENTASHALFKKVGWATVDETHYLLEAA